MSKKILFVFAHPDDESFACAGTIAKYRDMGHEISLICATSGCKGKSGDFHFDCREKLARHREKEMQQAADIIGVSHLYFYRYLDGSLKDQDLYELAYRIQSTMLEVKPDIVVTFPPDGVTGHPDHIAVTQATEQAILSMEQAGVYNGDVYFASIPHYYDHCGQLGPHVTFPITAKVDITGYREVKGKALQAHRSQIYSLNRAYPGVINGDHQTIGNYEYYTQIHAKGQPLYPFHSSGEMTTIELI